jgi:hypothetical protein
MMRNVLAGVTMIGLATIAFLASDPAQAQDKDKKKGKGAGKAPYVHTVIFHLKKDAPKDAVDDLITDSHKMLAKIPSVRGLWIGRPAEKSTPKFSVKDYDTGLLVLFDDYDGLEEYLKHKLHTDFVEKHGKNFDRVVVYDFIDKK